MRIGPELYDTFQAVTFFDNAVFAVKAAKSLNILNIEDSRPLWVGIRQSLKT
jgi:hypothetical protein